MGWASERAIGIHNELIATDEEYTEEYFRQEAEYQAWFECLEDLMEEEIDWFEDFRLAHDGYCEIDEPIFSSDISDDDIPF